MSEITIKAGKFQRLLDYLDQIGLDSAQVAARLNLLPERILALPPDALLPAQQYARLYKAAAAEMQTLGQPIPWAAGLGSEAFQLMCHCVISARTLGDALQLAERYDRLLYPMLGYNMRVLDVPGEAHVKLSYRVVVDQEDSTLHPKQWDRAAYKETVAYASGLLVWHAFCGWL